MNDAVCQKCGEWATVIQYGMRTCLKCGHVTPPETAPEVAKVLEDFTDACLRVLREQLRARLLATPPDDRDADWHRQMKLVEKEDTK
jgi:hypothetical protein